jgi:predicted AAA+ superfamily ATPase
LRNGILNNFSDLNQRTDRGAILENFVFNQLAKQEKHPDNVRMWRTQNQNEVDFIWQEDVKEPYPIEVKFKYDSKQPVPPGIKSFLRLYPTEKAYIVHLGDFHTRKFENTTCYAIPAWAV